MSIEVICTTTTMLHRYTNFFQTNLHRLSVIDFPFRIRLQNLYEHVSIEKYFSITNVCSEQTLAQLCIDEVIFRRIRKLILYSSPPLHSCLLSCRTGIQLYPVLLCDPFLKTGRFGSAIHDIAFI